MGLSSSRASLLQAESASVAGDVPACFTCECHGAPLFADESKSVKGNALRKLALDDVLGVPRLVQSPEFGPFESDTPIYSHRMPLSSFTGSLPVLSKHLSSQKLSRPNTAVLLRPRTKFASPADVHVLFECARHSEQGACRELVATYVAITSRV